MITTPKPTVHQGITPKQMRRGRLNNTKFALFVAIHRIAIKGGKHYAQPSIDSLLKLLSARHTTQVQRRWAFQCLHDLEAAGYITRKERFIHDPDGQWKQITSLITITLRGAHFLFSKGVAGAAALVKSILTWLKSGDKRWPSLTLAPAESREYQAPGALTHIGGVLSRLEFA